MRFHPLAVVVGTLTSCLLSVACDASSVARASAPLNAGDAINMGNLFPSPNRTFYYYHYSDSGALLSNPATGYYVEQIWQERWGSSFTQHHWYAPRWCPQTSDLFTWSGNQLLYQATYSFGEPDPNTGAGAGTYQSESNVWADAQMTLGAPAASSTETVSTYPFTYQRVNDTCTNLNISPTPSTVNTYTVYRQLVLTSDWSPYTDQLPGSGGPGSHTMMANALLLGNTLCTDASCSFKVMEEKMTFLWDPTQNQGSGAWIQIRTQGWQNNGSFLWDARLAQ